MFQIAHLILGKRDAKIPYNILVTMGWDDRVEDLSGSVIVATTDLCKRIERKAYFQYNGSEPKNEPNLVGKGIEKLCY